MNNVSWNGNKPSVHRMIYFLSNLLFMLCITIADFSWLGLAAFAVLNLLTYVFYVRNNDSDTPACGNLIGLVFIDLVCMIFIRYREMSPYLRLENLYDVTESIDGSLGGVALLGTICCLISAATDPLWGFIGKSLLSSFVILAVFNNGQLPELMGLTRIHLLIFGYVCLYFVWYVCVAVTLKANSYFRTAANIMSLVILFATLLAPIVYKGYFMTLSGQVLAELPQFLADMSAWWKIILAAVVLGALAVYMADFSMKNVGVDSVVFIMAAGLLILTKLILENYFPFNGLVLLIASFWCVHCVKNVVAQKKVMGLNPILGVLIQFAGAAVFLWLMAGWLWYNAVITIVFGALLFGYMRKHNDFYVHKKFWLLLVTAAAAEIMIYLFILQIPAEYILFALVLYAAAAAALLFFPEADRNICPKSAVKICTLSNAAVGVLTVLLLTMLMGRMTGEIDVEVNENGRCVILSVEEEEGLSDIRLEWYQIAEERPDKLSRIRNSEHTETIAAKRLEISAVGENGVQYRRTIWFPVYLLDN